MRSLERSGRLHAPPEASAGVAVRRGEVPLATDEPGSYRPIRHGTLREILDAEYRRNYRFEGFSDFVSDLKGLLRKLVVREEEFGDLELFPDGVPPRSVRRT